MAIDYKRIGVRIKRYRLDKHLTQEQLGNAVHSSAAMVTALERGVKVPSLETLIHIANTLEVSADDILVDVLTHSESAVGNEVQEILLDCNRREKEIIIRALKFLKSMLSEVGV